MSDLKKRAWMQHIIFGGALAVILFIGGSSFMSPDVYQSRWWFGLWTVIAVGLLYSILKSRLWRTPLLLLYHLSLLLILIGGGVTALTSVRGTLHLKPEETAGYFLTESGERVELPEKVTLGSFLPEYYPGMNFPRDFRTILESEHSGRIEISMNKIGKLDSFRFYQTSFDEAGGTILTVSRDPWGIALTYTGYLLFMLSGAGVIFKKWNRGRVRSGLPALVVVVGVLSPGNVRAASSESLPLKAISEVQADSLRTVQVEFNGRIITFNTLAEELTLKLTGKENVGDMDGVRFIGSLMAFSDEWKSAPFLLIKDNRLRRVLNSGRKYISPSGLYDEEGNYIPQRYYRGGNGDMDKGILQLDERVALLGRLWGGTLFNPLGEKDEFRRSPFEVAVETGYSRIGAGRWYFILLFCSIILIAWGKGTRIVYGVAGGIGLFLIGCRWIIAGYFPVANSSQIFLFMAVGIIVTGLIVRSRSRVVNSLVMLLAGCVALVSWLAGRDPAMTPLMPVLASPWLAIHVSLVMVGYSILGFTLPTAIAGLIVRGKASEYAALIDRLLMPGTYILAVGIFAGAMWANVSWGRYWAWDPKETWALVTLLLYALPLHKGLGLLRTPRVYLCYVIFCSLSIVMTYAGVNLLPSLHAY